MKEDLPEKKLPENEKEEYQSGMSDAEKLMNRHLHTEGDVVTDEDIKNIKIKKDAIEAGDTSVELEERLKKEEKEPGPDNPKTPWDVLGEG
ncbi:MAG: hypothetical protein ABR503_01955 [Chitinophagaceae bacterium]